ncbi:MAG: PLP-dependent aspartate aminotransferase family protein [Haloarculaceae archaeon]
MDPDAGVEFDTLAVANYGESPAGDVTLPIHLSSTYELPGVDPDARLEDVDPDAGEFLYGRLANPTRHAVEAQLADLEGGEAGYAFASGTAAIATATLSVLDPGDHLVAFEDLYAGTRRMFEEFLQGQLGVAVEFVDATDVATVEAAVDRDTAMVWMETPTNPLMHLCDVAAIAEVAAAHGAVFGVDNTFASPYFQRPLALGADIVAHSTTKYLNGHSDGIGGALVTDDPGLAEAIEFRQRVALGNGLAPFDSYLLSRGLKTLPARMRGHEANAVQLARYLAAHDGVEAVHYPGLETHPQHELASEQMAGYGGTLSFEIDGGIEAATAFLEAMETATLAVSLGGVESLVEHPATMTHEPLGPDRRADLGLTDSLIRLSVGLEGLGDLRTDLDRGFDAVDRL